jgi:GAF domain
MRCHQLVVPGDLPPVFEAMLANAVRICEANFGVLFRSQSGEFYPAGWAGVPPEYEAFLRRRGQFRPTDGAPLDRLLKTKQLVFTVDEVAERHPGPAAEFGGARSLIAVPMFKDGELVGAIVIYRQEVDLSHLGQSRTGGIGALARSSGLFRRLILRRHGRITAHALSHPLSGPSAYGSTKQ